MRFISLSSSSSSIIVLLSCLVFDVINHAFGFTVQNIAIRQTRSCCWSGPIFMSSTSGDDAPKVSRIEGNQRQPTQQEMEVMDEMITKLSDAKPYELPNAVRRAFRVISSPQFFLRIAQRVDEADSAMEKEKLSALSANLVSTLEAVVETTEEQLDERAKEVESVVKAAAEPDSGEFLVPLIPERITAMRDTMEKIESSLLDEGFLSTVDAWMNKSHQDGMDGMVGILQKVLQMYSGLQISRARAINKTKNDESSSSSAAAELFDKLLQVDTDTWDMEIQKGIQTVPASALVKEVQGTMESVVLGLDSGSMAQRVQAEYLRELVTRIEALDKK